VLNNVGVIYMDLEQYITAETYFLREIQATSVGSCPPSPGPHFNLGLIYLEAGQRTQVIGCLEALSDYCVCVLCVCVCVIEY
jgi:hypothetical protein